MLPTVNIFGFTVATYTILLIVGLSVGAALLFLLRSRRALPKSDTAYASMFAIIGGLIGAKVLFLIVNLNDFLSSPDPLTYILYSGIVFYGGILGGALALFLYCRKYGLSFMAFFDAAAPGVCFGQAIGRVGCFCAGCCYGIEADTPISVRYPAGGPAPAGIPILPTQLMEAAFLLLLGTALIIAVIKIKQTGIVACAYMLGYGIWRFVIEFFRSDPRGAFLGLSTSQLISIGIVVLGIAAAVWSVRGAKSKAASASEQPFPQ